MPRLFDRPKYARWTPEEVAQLTKSLEAGESISAIAMALGRSQEAVRNKAWQRGTAKAEGPQSRVGF